MFGRLVAGEITNRITLSTNCALQHLAVLRGSSWESHQHFPRHEMHKLCICAPFRNMATLIQAGKTVLQES